MDAIVRQAMIRGLRRREAHRVEVSTDRQLTQEPLSPTEGDRPLTHDSHVGKENHGGDEKGFDRK